MWGGKFNRRDGAWEIVGEPPTIKSPVDDLPKDTQQEQSTAKDEDS